MAVNCIPKVKFIISCFLLLSAGAKGQQTETANQLTNLSFDDLLQVKIIGVSKYAQDISRAPATALVVTQRQILDRGYEDLNEVLRDLPGFDITDNAGRMGEFYTIRGITGNDRFLILLDGHKINPPSGTYLSIGNSISVRDLARIEVIYGPASAMYGADAFSGIINLVSKNCGFEKHHLSVSFNGGSQNRRDVALAGRVRLSDDLSFSLSSRYIHSNGPDFTGRDPQFDIIHQYIPPQRNHFDQPTYDHTIMVQGCYKNLTAGYFRTGFNEGNALGMSPAFYIYNRQNRWNVSNDLLWALYEKSFDDGSELTLDVSLVRHKLNNQSQFYKWQRPGDPTSGGYHQYMTGLDRSGRLTATYTKKLCPGTIVIAGMDLEHTRSIPPYANDQVLGEPLQYTGKNKTLIDDALTIDEKRYGFFSQLTISPHPAVDIILGGRYDYLTRYTGIFNPRLGCISRLRKGSTIKLLYGRAFQAPSLFYEFEQFGTPDLVMLSVEEIQQTINKDWSLKNQRLTTYEVSLTQVLSGHSQLTLSGYHNVLTDLIERQMFDSTASIYNKYFDRYTDALMNINIGRQEISGINATINTHHRENIESYIYYSFTDAQITSSGGVQDVPRVSRHKIWAGLTLRNLGHLLTVSTRVKWVGKMSHANRPFFPSGYQKGYTNVDLTLSADISHLKTRLTLVAENLFDADISHGGLITQGGIYTPVIPQNLRQIRLGATFSIH